MRKLSSNCETSLLKILCHILLVFICVFAKAQQKEYWLVDTQTQRKTLAKDSLSAVKFLDSLSQNNYYLTELKKVTKDGNKTEIYYDKGKNFNEAVITLTEEITQISKLTQQFFTKNIDSLKKEINEDYRNQGFAFNRVKSKFIEMKDGIPQVEISVVKGDKRKIDSFVIKGYEKVPKRFIKNLEKEFQGKIYDDKNLVQI